MPVVLLQVSSDDDEGPSYAVVRISPSEAADLVRKVEAVRGLKAAAPWQHLAKVTVHDAPDAAWVTSACHPALEAVSEAADRDGRAEVDCQMHDALGDDIIDDDAEVRMECDVVEISEDGVCWRAYPKYHSGMSSSHEVPLADLQRWAQAAEIHPLAAAPHAEPLGWSEVRLVAVQPASAPTPPLLAEALLPAADPGTSAPPASGGQ